MSEIFSRTELVLGKDALGKLKECHVILFGLGGVGSYVVEALVRSGIGALTIVDNDEVCESNLNRQLIATRSTIGLAKVDACEKRILDINPECRVAKLRMFYLPETADSIRLSDFDYVVDCIDTVTAKLELAVRSKQAGVPLISSMGTGNKVHPELLRVADISKTSVCPLARVMRRELSVRGIRHLKCVFSTEEPVKTPEVMDGRKRVPGSTAFVPSVAGLLIASEVVRDLVSNCDDTDR